MPIITTNLLEQGDETLSGFNIVWAVRAINGLFGANCSKAIKFGLDVDRTLLDRFRVDAKKGSPCATVGAKSKMAATRYQKYQN